MQGTAGAGDSRLGASGAGEGDAIEAGGRLDRSRAAKTGFWRSQLSKPNFGWFVGYTAAASSAAPNRMVPGSLPSPKTRSHDTSPIQPFKA